MSQRRGVGHKRTRSQPSSPRQSIPRRSTLSRSQSSPPAVADLPGENADRHRAHGEGKRGALGLLAAVVALGLIGLGFHAIPAAVGVDRLTSLVAAPATASPVAPGGRELGADRAPNSPAPSAAPKPQRPEPVQPTDKVHVTPKVPATGPGSYVRAGVDVDPASDRGRLIRFDVQVEKNLAIDSDDAARLIAKVLNDRRSWRGTGRWRFQLVSSASEATLHAYIVTPGTTDRLCAPLLTRGEVSCQNGNRVVLNAKRWMLGADSYGSDVAGYRRYLVNHEFGHSLGYQHVGCPSRGKRAPVMMQQTKGLGGCRKNPWPLSGSD